MYGSAFEGWTARERFLTANGLRHTTLADQRDSPMQDLTNVIGAAAPDPQRIVPQWTGLIRGAFARLAVCLPRII